MIHLVMFNTLFANDAIAAANHGGPLALMGQNTQPRRIQGIVEQVRHLETVTIEGK